MSKHDLGDVYTAELKVRGGGPVRRFFTAKSYVRKDEAPTADLAVGDSVVCKTLFGETRAKVTEIEAGGQRGYAETTGLVLVLYKDGSFWCCDHAISKKGFEDLGRMRIGASRS